MTFLIETPAAQDDSQLQPRVGAFWLLPESLDSFVSRLFELHQGRLCVAFCFQESHCVNENDHPMVYAGYRVVIGFAPWVVTVGFTGI